MTRIAGDLAGMPVCARPATASQRRPAGAAHAFRLCTAPLLGPSHRHHYAGEVSTGGSGAGARRPAGPYQPCTEAHLIHRMLDPDPAGRPSAADILRVAPSPPRRPCCSASVVRPSQACPALLVTTISSRPFISPLEHPGLYGLASAPRRAASRERLALTSAWARRPPQEVFHESEPGEP